MIRPRYPLIVALVMSGMYAVQIHVDLARPRLDPSEPLLRLFGDRYPAVFNVVSGLILASWLTALGLAVAAAVFRERRTALQWAAAIVLLTPFSVPAVVVVLTNPWVTLLCLPSTAFALWLIARMQRFRRLPGWLVLAVFAWGAIIATGFGGTMNDWAMRSSIAYLFDAGNPLQGIGNAYTTAFLGGALFEEAGKGAAVLLAYLCLRHHIDSVVSGIVLGATVGLGFNLTETVLYMAASDGALHYWGRQSVGLMAAHTVFSAVVGAGFGAARQLTDPRLRRLVIGAGFLSASGGHFASNVLFSWVGQQQRGDGLLAFDPAINVLIVLPMTLLVLQGPLLIICFMLFRRGTRAEATGFGSALWAEHATGSGAVTEIEVPILCAPGKRRWLRIKLLRSYGLDAYQAVRRLQAAQFDLAALRWHQARGEPGEQPSSIDELRGRIRRHRAELAAATASAPRTVEVPA